MNRKVLFILLILSVAVLLLSACATPTPQLVPQTVVVPQTVAVPQTQVVEKVVTAAPPPATSAPAAPAPQTINALVGAGTQTVAAIGFYPRVLTVHVGDTINWKYNTDEIHTVTFTDGKLPKGADPTSVLQDPLPGAGPGDVLPNFPAPIAGGKPTDLQFNPVIAFPTRHPGAPVETWDGTGFVNSGALSNQPAAPGAPPNNTFSLTFTNIGLYHYICLVHLGQMTGTVHVLPPNTGVAPSQADVDAQAKKESGAILALIDKAVAAATDATVQPLPDKTNLVFVRAGVQEGDTFIGLGQSMTFGPKETKIKVGDTVVWASTYFHTVTFNPTPPPPDFIVPKPNPQGPPTLVINPLILFPMKPSQVYDPTKYYNSGTLTPGGPFGTTFSLTFDKPGTYEYFCGVHYQQGMKGTITVTQ